MSNSQETIYKTMETAGAAGVASGITVIVIGIAAGVLMIINGAKLLARKRNVLM